MNPLALLLSFLRPSRHREPAYCAQLLDRARRAIQIGKIDLAEAFVLEAGDGAWKDSACLNLLGLIAEARGDWSAACRLWGRASRLDRGYAPSRQNLRRHFELFQFGATRQPVAFGNEASQPGVVSL